MKTFKTAGGLELPLMQLQGKDYLQVMHRIQWMRSEHQDWVITSRIVERTDAFVIMEANILDGQGKVISSAHKCGPFGPKHLEKSESGAVGRALAFLGYGTQFAEDLEEGDDLADAPVEPKPQAPKPPPQNMAPQSAHRSLSEAQVNRLYAIAKKSQYSNEDVNELLRRYKVGHPKDLLKADYDAICAYMERIPRTQAASVGIA